MHCLQSFISEEILSRHKKVCISINGKQAVNMPKKGEKVKYINHHKEIKIPFVIYADFEAIIKKIEGPKNSDEKSIQQLIKNI